MPTEVVGTIAWDNCWLLFAQQIIFPHIILSVSISFWLAWPSILFVASLIAGSLTFCYVFPESLIYQPPSFVFPVLTTWKHVLNVKSDPKKDDVRSYKRCRTVCLDYCDIACIAGRYFRFTFQKASSFFSASFLIPSVFSVTYRH